MRGLSKDRQNRQRQEDANPHRLRGPGVPGFRRCLQVWRFQNSAFVNRSHFGCFVFDPLNSSPDSRAARRRPPCRQCQIYLFGIRIKIKIGIKIRAGTGKPPTQRKSGARGGRRERFSPRSRPGPLFPDLFRQQIGDAPQAFLRLAPNQTCGWPLAS